MDRLNVVGQAVFDIRFHSAMLAVEHQETLASMIKTDLLQVLDEVLSDAVPCDTVLDLETLEIDLGRVQCTDYREELPKRLRKQLKEYFDQLLSDNGPETLLPARRLSLEENAVETLRFFLLHGFLPWNQVELSLEELETTFLRCLQTTNEEFFRFIRDTRHRDRILKRIVAQFAPATVLELIHALHRNQGAATATVPVAPPSPHGRQQLLRYLQAAVTKKKSAGGLPSALEQRLTKALQTGDALHINHQWSFLLREHDVELLAALAFHGREALVRKRIAEGFPESMVRDILALLEPVESEFVETLTQHPELFSARTFVGRQERMAQKRLLWEFTLGYLLEARGSLFNRKSYLASLVGQLAAYSNIALNELLITTEEILLTVDLPPALTSGLFTLLQELLEASMPVQSTSGKDHRVETQKDHAQQWQQIGEILLHGLPEDLEQNWQLLKQEDSSRLRDLIFQAAADQTRRRSLVDRLSKTMYWEILTLLAPGEAVFLEQLTRYPQLFTQGPTDFAGHKTWRAQKKLLREYTLGYLLEVRGSFFNRASYLAGLIAQIAAFSDIAPNKLLRTIQSSLTTLDLPSALTSELSSLLQELLAVSAPVQPTNGTTLLPRTCEHDDQTWQQIGELLFLGLPEDLHQIWQLLKEENPSRLRELFLQAAADQARRRNLADRLSQAMFAEILTLLAPGEAVFLKQITRHPQLFSHETADQYQDETKGKKTLRELTLEYLIEERGSAFNQRAYMRHLIQQMAIRRNMNHRDLLHSMRNSLNLIPLSRELQRQLLHLIDELLAELSPSSKQVEPLSSEETSLLKATIFCDALLEHLLPSSEAGAHWPFKDPIAPQLQEIISRFPERIFALLQRLQMRFPGQLNRSHGLVAEELMRLIELVLLLLHGSTGERRSNFLHAIGQWAGQAGTPHRYLTRVLEQLLGNQPIDCQALLEEDAPVKGEQTTLPDTAPSLEPREHCTEEVLLSELESYFFETNPSKVKQAWLQLQIKLQAERSEGWISRLMQKHLEGESLDRLIDLLPDHLLLGTLLTGDTVRVAALAREAGRLAVLLPLLVPGIDLTRIRRITWHFLVTYSFQGINFPSLAAALRVLAGQFARLAGWNEYSQFIEQLQRLHGQLDPIIGELAAPLLQRLTDDAQLVQAAPCPPLPSTRNQPPLLWRLDKAEESPESIGVVNAGLVLAAPYLMRLFAMLGLLDNNRFADEQAAERALLMLHFLATGSTCAAEPTLVLNKVLCGLELEQPVAAQIELANGEQQAIEGLISAMIGHWSVLGATSVEGFRESFLQREGLLQRSNENWHLLVEPRAYDLLLDQIPWSFTFIKLPWMIQSLQVEWRHGL